jgi:hypothetical protein
MKLFMTRMVNSVEHSTLIQFPRKGVLVMMLLLAALFSQSSYAQDKDRPFQKIRARLVNSRTGGPVVFAQVFSKELRSGAVSDSLGVFSLSVRMNDTLYIRSISFYSTTIRVTDSLIWQMRIPIIPLAEQAYEFGTIDVYGWGSYQEFKYKFLHTPAPEDKTKKLQDDLMRSLKRGPSNGGDVEMRIPLGSPITDLYNLFSKEGKFLRRYKRAVERDRVFLLTYQKFNRDIVGQVTGLTGNLLDQFMLFCRPDDEFLLQANDYDIYHRILEDYERFKKEILEKTKKASLLKERPVLF